MLSYLVADGLGSATPPMRQDQTTTSNGNPMCDRNSSDHKYGQDCGNWYIDESALKDKTIDNEESPIKFQMAKGWKLVALSDAVDLIVELGSVFL
jgi:hypothetical protein